jgi:hypothetical protein
MSNMATRYYVSSLVFFAFVLSGLNFLIGATSLGFLSLA